MIMFDNNWFQFFDSPIVVMFFALTVVGLFWSPVVRGFSRMFAKRMPLEMGD